jgi:hypothetical protein
MREWKERWDEYRQWAESHAEPDSRSPAQIMSDIEFLYRSYPLEVRRTDPDPEKSGIQHLYRILALYERTRQSRIDAG